ncbi:hypothetical protein O6P43_013764 [Quillaja saponaria]|uniref:Uncharacterized protein n=1 Tax=Quillaja saponaria TaxID=32244 RepID=A0AAD7LTM7_QUISA|nr:hypothetical protein O6P43_013764 [Quillaja saponaria]
MDRARLLVVFALLLGEIINLFIFILRQVLYCGEFLPIFSINCQGYGDLVIQSSGQSCSRERKGGKCKKQERKKKLLEPGDTKKSCHHLQSETCSTTSYHPRNRHSQGMLLKSPFYGIGILRT